MFELLDDPAAGPPPASFRSGVTRRVRRRRRRRALGAGSLAAVSALGLGGLVARDRLEPERVEVAGLPEREPTADEPATVLFVGVDAGLHDSGLHDSGLRGEREGALADTIVLARIDPGAEQVRLLPVPRDLLVTDDGGDPVRINTLVATGGPELLVRAIRDELGVQVDRYVEADVAGAVAIVDALGGLRLAVGDPVRAPSTGVDLAVGCQTLSGEQVVALGRARKDVLVHRDGGWHLDGSGDLGRLRRASAIAAATLQAIGRVGSTDLPGLVASGLDEVRVDQATDAGDVLALGRVAARAEVVTLGLPVAEVELASGAAVLELIRPAAADVVAGLVDGFGDGTGPAVDGPPIDRTEDLQVEPC